MVLLVLSSRSPVPSPLLPIANDVTGKPASQAYPLPDKGIIVLSQRGIFFLFIPSGKGREMDGMHEHVI